MKICKYNDGLGRCGISGERCTEGPCDCEEIIEYAPVRHGRWAYIGGDEWCCTNCGEVISTEGRWERPSYNYCHECGAKMDALTLEEASRKLGRQAAETLKKLKEEGHAGDVR